MVALALSLPIGTDSSAATTNPTLVPEDGSNMAKALLGYVGNTDPVLTSENARLRLRVRDLEAEITRLKNENDALHASISESLTPADLLEPVSH